MHDYVDCYRSNKYDIYDLSDVDASGAGLMDPTAVQGVLDFISGLKQTRADVKKTVDQQMVHSEKEVVEALAVQFEENMRIDEADVEEESKQPDKPIFVKK